MKSRINQEVKSSKSSKGHVLQLVKQRFVGMRLDQFIKALFPHATRGFVQQMIQSGEVLVDGKVVWDLQHYRELADQVKDAAELEGVRIEWGGEAFGPKFIDGPHFQLPRSFYPDGD